MTGERYLHRLRISFLLLISDNSQHLQPLLYFLDDGAPPQYWLQVSTFLDTSFNVRWIGRSRPIEGPPRPPDLTPMEVENMMERIGSKANAVTTEMIQKVAVAAHCQILNKSTKFYLYFYLRKWIIIDICRKMSSTRKKSLMPLAMATNRVTGNNIIMIFW